MIIRKNNHSLFPNANFLTHLWSSKDDAIIHTHTYFEFVYIVYGKIDHICNNECISLKKGDMVLLRPGDIHYYKRGESDCVHRDIVVTEVLLRQTCDYLRPGLFEEIIQKQQCIYGNLNNTQIDFFESTFAYISNMFDKSSDAIQLFINGVLGAILTALYMRNDEIDNNSYPIWIKEILTRCTKLGYVKGDYQTLLADIPYDHAHICRTFKKYTGQTITEHLNKIRLNTARTYLFNTDMSIERIVEEIGLTNYSYFIKLFKKQYGITPLQYRQQAKKRLTSNTPKNNQ